jgi:hypothetical protein
MKIFNLLIILWVLTTGCGSSLYYNFGVINECPDVGIDVTVHTSDHPDKKFTYNVPAASEFDGGYRVGLFNMEDGVWYYVKLEWTDTIGNNLDHSNLNKIPYTGTKYTPRKETPTSFMKDGYYIYRGNSDMERTLVNFYCRNRFRL